MSDEARLQPSSWLSSGAADSGGFWNRPLLPLGEVSHFCVLTETWAYVHPSTYHDLVNHLYMFLFVFKSVFLANTDAQEEKKKENGEGWEENRRGTSSEIFFISTPILLKDTTFVKGLKISLTNL